MEQLNILQVIIGATIGAVIWYWGFAWGKREAYKHCIREMEQMNEATRGLLEAMLEK